MKKVLLTTTALMMCAQAASAGQTFVDVPVISTQVIQATSETRTPVRNCTEQLIRVDQQGRSQGGNSAVGTLLGAAIGGFTGSQIGSGSGQLAATALGTLGGAVVGNRAMRSNGLSKEWPLNREEQRYKKEVICTTSYNIQHQTNIVGYNVTYNFEGQTYTTRMQTPPGKSIRLMLNTTHTVSK